MQKRRSAALAAIIVVLGAAVVRAQTDGRRVSISESGAIGDGVTLNTTTIQAAIDTLASSGGGTLVIPKGKFVSGALFLKPGVHLHLEKEGVLKCSTDMSNYPARRTRIEGHFEPNFPPALINADGCDGLRITGEGTLDGNGLKPWEDFWARKNAAKDQPNFVNLTIHRARLCLIEHSKNVTVKGITFKDSQFWNLHLYDCQDSIVENCRFEIPDSGSGPSTDGVDIDSCQNIVVRGCYRSVNDDCVCVKGSRFDGVAQEPNSPPVKNVLVENCTFVRGHGALTLGSEAQGISDVEMRDCEVMGGMPVLRIKFQPDTANQDYQNVRIRNIRVDSKEGYIVQVSPFHGTKVPRPTAPISKASDILIENVSGKIGSFGSLSGGNVGAVSNFTFRNIQLTTTKNSKLAAEGVAGITLENVTVEKAK